MHMTCPIDREINPRWIEDRLTTDMWSFVSAHEANSGEYGEPDLGPTKRIHQQLWGDGLVQQARALEAAVMHNALCAVRATQDPSCSFSSLAASPRRPSTGFGRVETMPSVATPMWSTRST